MSDHDAAPDPIDKAYTRAEALLDDDAARAARRAKVLAAVAGEPAAPAAAPPVTITPAKPRPAWRRGGWLAAASVAGLSALVAFQIQRTPVVQQQPAPASPPIVGAAEAPEAVPPVATAPAPAPAARAPAPAAEAAADAASAGPPAPRVAPLEMPEGISPAPPAAPPPPPPPAPAAAPPPPPPPPPAPTAQMAARAADAAAAPASPVAPSAEVGSEEVVVTGSQIRPSRAAQMERSGRSSPAALGARLRAAATAGRLGEMRRLLAEGAPVDGADEAGETALMKAVQANQPAAAALLRRQGASVERENRAGESARDMATELGDPELSRALGLGR